MKNSFIFLIIFIFNNVSNFGKPNTDYDFQSKDPSEAHKELNKIQEEQTKLSKQINKKVLSMFEK